jgi:hypothetical protein
MVGSAKNDLLGYYATQNSLKVCSKIPSEYQKIPMTLYGVIFHEAIIWDDYFLHKTPSFLCEHME